ncbi:MAG: hypothetical protein HKN72_04595 [Gemmatimonadetes bacterium]|nr:hypothetical protein [Gemmatimonadota bacterium]NNF12473.1 hypothetical protein [Gemmatimonadota bacterium]NNL31515.1 hypothetical protein [Gemmatimonadota bacterium]
MARSLAGAVSAKGASGDEVAALSRAFHLAMGPRVDLLDDDHHPAYLHPGRGPLILLQDVGTVDVSVLMVAALHESRDHELRVPAAEVEAEVGPAAKAAVESIPRPGDERLVERLLTLGPGLSLAALAERLDHIRHLHVRKDLVDDWAPTYTEVLEAWLPFAERTNPQLARRYAHWARTFVKRI